ncbi:radical SAM protein [Pelosinus sp. IPA-1]|uniref:radical SAM protein n=1 Tax=Pelosinus sp. IPA-1 TaxID=3029569 RepID=UPI002436195E|nr:radical SAM protein [Pelosinus sp. IPA-1]GMA99239.1 radical SAM protein [Pelosinus sp. IPA-1]
MNLWKLSAGTACLIGKKKFKADVLPTTAYIMLGERCKNNCQFCAQSRDSEARVNLLSRVTWPVFPKEEAAAGIRDTYEAGAIKRACLQVVYSANSWDTTVDALELLHANSAVPICISSHLETVKQARELVSRGAERVCIALDAATPELFGKVKKGQWASKWSLLLECALALPGLVTTHLIVGLGESEADMVSRMAVCIDKGIRIGLFAFTPIRGTPWAHLNAPTIAHYRRIQIAHHLLRNGYKQDIIGYQDGIISEYNVPKVELLGILKDGQAFQTSGCDDCNRPYYNERPGGLMYNYPRRLTSLEVTKAIKECEIIRGENDELATN